MSAAVHQRRLVKLLGYGTEIGSKQQRIEGNGCCDIRQDQRQLLAKTKEFIDLIDRKQQDKRADRKSQLQKSLQAAAHTVTAVIQPGQAHGAGKRNDDLHSKRADSDKSRIFVQREQIQRLQRGYIVPKVQRIRQREWIVHDLAVRLHRDKDQPDDRDHNCDCQKHHQDVAHAQLFSYSHGRPSQSFPRSSSV